MNACGALYQISVSLVCPGKQPCRVPPWLARNNLRDFTLRAFKAAVAVTLHASAVFPSFSPMGEWANWQIGGIGICRWCQCWIRQRWAQHAEQTPWRDALSWDLRWRSRKSLPRHVSRFFFRVSGRFEVLLVGGEPVCYIHLILHDMEKVSQHAIFVLFITAWRLVPCCFWEAANAVTHPCGISCLASLFSLYYLFHLSVISCFAVTIVW